MGEICLSGYVSIMKLYLKTNNLILHAMSKIVCSLKAETLQEVEKISREGALFFNIKRVLILDQRPNSKANHINTIVRSLSSWTCLIGMKIILQTYDRDHWD